MFDKRVDNILFNFSGMVYMQKILLALSVLGLSTGCTGGGDHNDSGHHASGNKHWSYVGMEGPSHWASLSDEFGLCESGNTQSPINIAGEHQMNLRDIEFDYSDSTDSVVVNNGHTIQVNYAAGSSALIGGKKYNLLQFHFHSPSEHQIHGKHADLVAHLVHKSDDGQLAVVAVLFDRGANNSFLSPVWKVMPTAKGEAIVPGILRVEDLLPADKGYFNYSGSLTTPPCSEGVNWNILTTHAPVSSAQVVAFAKIFPKSIRPVQNVNDRMIGVK
ncbi:MAG: carbonic anhydrase family protein [Gammaproteobacteria bacterium]|nr:carbonic anhydrase family protein [Gammaproteobacteria bacterium]